MIALTKRAARILLGASIGAIAYCPSAVTAQTADWPDLYDPTSILDLHFKIKRADFDAINADGTFAIEVPALFWEGADGDTLAQLVSIRRKSGSNVGTKVRVAFQFIRICCVVSCG